MGADARIMAIHIMMVSMAMMVMIVPMMIVIRVFMGVMIVVPLLGSTSDVEMSSTFSWRSVRSRTV